MPHRPNEIIVDGDMARVVLTSRTSVVAHTLIDTSDIPLVRAVGYRWHLAIGNAVAATVMGEAGRFRTLFLHRHLLSAPKHLVVDHINHNPLDNRRCNLRLVTQPQNMQNLRGARRDSHTGVRNVHRHARNGRYYVIVYAQGKRYCLGSHDDLQTAASVAADARVKLMTHSMPEASR